MTHLKIVNNENEIQPSNKWVDSPGFNKGQIVSLKGRQYKVVAQKEHKFTKQELFGRSVLWFFANLFTFFAAGLFSKKVRDLTADKEYIQFAVPFKAAVVRQPASAGTAAPYKPKEIPSTPVTTEGDYVPHISTAGRLQLVNKHVGNVHVAGSFSATNSKIGQMNVAGSTELHHVECSGKIDVAGSFKAFQCPALGNIDTSGAVTIEQCPNVQQIHASGSVRIDRVNVAENVDVTGSAQVKDSQIGKRLKCHNRELVVDHSQIDNIDLRKVYSGSGNIQQTEYNFLIFKITKTSYPSGSQSSQGGSEPIEQIIELRDSTVRDIVFESGIGKVKLIGNSAVTGTITGGQII